MGQISPQYENLWNNKKQISVFTLSNFCLIFWGVLTELKQNIRAIKEFESVPLQKGQKSVP